MISFLQYAHMLLLVLQTSAAMDASIKKSPHCQDKCGDISIPYPFGIGHGCFRPGFEVTCKQMVEIAGEFKAFFGNSSSRHEVKNISVLDGSARTLSPVTSSCKNNADDVSLETSIYLVSEDLPMFKISSRNRFTAIGCDTVGLVLAQSEKAIITGCASSCFDTSAMENGSCSGIGCCQAPVPDGLNYYDIALIDASMRRRKTRNPCIYAFLVDEDWFEFDKSDVYDYNFRSKSKDGVPLVLEWVAGKETCGEAGKNASSFACRSSNSVCVDSKQGYRCNCSTGYQGNPYIPGGCIDIDECSEQETEHACFGVCTNLAGSYRCSCPPGESSDDPKTKRCLPINPPTRSPAGLNLTSSDKLVIGNSVGAIFVFGCVFCLLLQHQKRKLRRDKDKFFRQNGGLRLYEEIRSKQVDTVKIYTKRDLERATGNFDRSNEIGRGGHGTVYRGRLEDGREVAIKRSKTIAGDDEGEQFVREMIILSHINHRNVVRLLGCCLEVEIPMLVYEFVPNKTLYDLIHGSDARRKASNAIPLGTRLRIARESAEALAYLHSWASPVILHGDVKSLNILLDDQFVPKVSDFGASRMLSMDKVQFITMVQGTLGYLDPEFLLSRRLTTKSDVYSFGVVMVELITRKKAIYNDKSGRERTLASDFLEALNDGKLEEILDAEIVGGEQANAMDVLREVAELAEKCLNLKGDERPTMREVAERLHASKRISAATSIPSSRKDGDFDLLIP